VYRALYKQSSETYGSFNKINMVSQNPYLLAIYYWQNREELKAASKAAAASTSKEMLAASMDD
jgi:hypothetical protein